MNVRNVALFAAAGIAVVAGIRMALESDRPAPDALADPARATDPAVGDPAGARPQVSIVTDEVTAVEDPPPGNRNGALVGTPEQREAERRMRELRQVLENLGGEPVYVEGVDGPLRSDPPKQR